MKVEIGINPGDVSINRRMVPEWRGGKPTGRLVLNSEYRSGVDSMSLQVRQACIKQGWKTSKRTCRAYIFTRWPGPEGDRDSVCKAVLDALQHGTVVVNDKQVIPTLDASWNSRTPGITVEIEEVTDA
jgi:Holliday junction resolvase RusA-like endonuclease